MELNADSYNWDEVNGRVSSTKNRTELEFAGKGVRWWLELPYWKKSLQRRLCNVVVVYLSYSGHVAPTKQLINFIERLQCSSTKLAKQN